MLEASVAATDSELRLANISKKLDFIVQGQIAISE
jgi:hypothetical protein